MSVRTRLCLISTTVLLAACAGSPPDDGNNGGRRGPPGGEHGDMREDGGTANPREALQAQLSDVERRLSLNARQQVAWERYREAIGALMADQYRMDPRPLATADAVKQIQRKVDVVRNRLSAMEDIAEAAGALYAVLDPEQRKVADRMLPGTVPALYSGLASNGGAGSSGGEGRGRGVRGGPPPGGR